MDPVMSLLAVLGVALSLSFTLYWWCRRRLWAAAAKIPGPPAYPIIGNVPIFMPKYTEILPMLLQGFENYGPVVRLWFGPLLYVYLREPNDIQAILGDPKIRNHDSLSNNLFKEFFGNGLFSLMDEDWRTRRKLVTPSFHLKNLEGYVAVFGRKVEILVKQLEKMEGRTFNVHHLMSLCTMDVICEAAIGTCTDTKSTYVNSLNDTIRDLVNVMETKLMKPWLLVNFFFNLSKERKNADSVNERMKSFSEKVIAKKVADYRRGIRSPSITTFNNKKISSFLDMMVEASENEGSILSGQDILNDITTLIAGGNETTATSMSFLLVLMGIHKEVQAEVHRELDEVFGSDDRPATPDDLQRLPLLDRCIKEALRLFPVATVLSRAITEDVHLPSGYTVPAGSTTVVLSIATHRDERYFPDPLSFRPERWLPENEPTTHRYAYIPFGVGPRNCIGQNFAKLEMKSIASGVLRQFHVTTPLTMTELNRLQIYPTVSLDVELFEGYRIQLQKRRMW